jgi:hypothetical protein
MEWKRQMMEHCWRYGWDRHFPLRSVSHSSRQFCMTWPASEFVPRHRITSIAASLLIHATPSLYGDIPCNTARMNHGPLPVERHLFMSRDCLLRSMTSVFGASNPCYETPKFSRTYFRKIRHTQLGRSEMRSGIPQNSVTQLFIYRINKYNVAFANRRNSV